MPNPQPNQNRTIDRATQNIGTSDRSTLFTVDKAESLIHRTSGPAIVHTQSYPPLHNEVRKSLIAIVKKYPNDGNDRITPLLDIANNVPVSQRNLLYTRLSRPNSKDEFVLYFNANFPITGKIFLEALKSDNSEQLKEQHYGPEPPSAAMRSTPLDTATEFVSQHYSDVKSDPMYIDNFTNDIMDAWLPNDKAFYFEYPNGMAALVSLQDLARSIIFEPSELELSELRAKKILKNLPSDLELPRSSLGKPGSYSLVTVTDLAPANVRFYRNIQTKIIYPVDASPEQRPIPKNYLPRVSSVLRQIQSVSSSEALWEDSREAILDVIMLMEWSPPVPFGILIVRIARFFSKLGKSGIRALRYLRGLRGAKPQPPKLASPGAGNIPNVARYGAQNLGAAAAGHPDLSPGNWIAVERNPGLSMDLQHAYSGKAPFEKDGKMYIEEYHLCIPGTSKCAYFDKFDANTGLLGDAKHNYGFLDRIRNPEANKSLILEADRQLEIADAYGFQLEWAIRKVDVKNIEKILGSRVSRIKLVPYQHTF